jgi:hypothetical protein
VEPITIKGSVSRSERDGKFKQSLVAMGGLDAGFRKCRIRAGRRGIPCGRSEDTSMPIGLQQLTVYAGDEGLGTNVSYGVGASGEAVITSNITLDRGLYSDVVDPLGKVQSLYHRIIPRVLSSLFVTSIAHVLQTLWLFLSPTFALPMTPTLRRTLNTTPVVLLCFLR